MWLHFVCVSRPGPGDVVDDALRKCDIAESKCISFLYFSLRTTDYANVKSSSLISNLCGMIAIKNTWFDFHVGFICYSTRFCLPACRLLQGAAPRPSGSCEFLWVCASCCHVSSCLPGPVAGSILPTDTPGSTTLTWRWLSQRTALGNTSAHVRYINI